jgi:hypothetical protein
MTKQNFDTISIWNKNSKDPEIVESIRTDLIRVLGLPEDVKMDYQQFFPENKPVPSKEARPPRDFGDRQGPYQ